MKLFLAVIGRLFLAAVLLTSGTAFAAEPYYLGTSQAIISAPGDYTIDRDITQWDPSQPAVIVTPGTHFVTIRLRSRIEGAGGPGSINAGIHAQNSAALTIIGDGGYIDGFAYGIRCDGDCHRARIEHVVVRQAWFRGIYGYGDRVHIEANTVTSIGGATWTPNAYCMGIEWQGMAADSFGRMTILNNTVRDVSAPGLGEAVGISLSDKAKGSVVRGNLIWNVTKPAKGFAIWVGGDSDVTLTGNSASTWPWFAAFGTPSTGRVAKDNWRGDMTADVLVPVGSTVVVE